MKLIFTFAFFLYYALSISQTVEPFLETIVSKFPNVRDVAISQNKDEVLFSAQSAMGDMSALVCVKRINGEWQEPEVVSFSGQYFDLEPFFSKDALTLYFVSNRPLDQTSETTKDFDIWYVQRESTISEWSQPINIGAPVNTEMDEFYPSITDSKNLYFTLDNPELKQKDNIYVSEFIDGRYTQPKQLGDAVNSEGYEFNAFVSSDESFIIYTCYNREGGFGSGDLYISTKSESGEWSPSKNMGNQINSDKMEYCPFVDETTNTLYFTSKRNALKPTFTSHVDLKGLLETFNSYENGLSRLYQVKLE
ncbi:MAG: hypothetical protein R2797_13300 [Gelidibacter sp.]